MPSIRKAQITLLPSRSQSSGVTVADVCKTTFEEIKKDKKHRYVIYFIRDEKQIEVESIGSSTSFDS
jgi:cofilin